MSYLLIKVRNPQIFLDGLRWFKKKAVYQSNSTIRLVLLASTGSIFPVEHARRLFKEEKHLIAEKTIGEKF